MFPQDLHFHFPAAAWLLGVIPVITMLFLWLYAYRRRGLHAFGSPEVLAQIVVFRSPVIYWTKAVALTLAWAMATFALMQPRGNGRYPVEAGVDEDAISKTKQDQMHVQRKAHDVIFLIDASASMGVKDTRVGLSRLAFAKEIVDETIAGLQGENVAIHAFTSDTTQLSPATMDYLFARLVLRQIGINEGDIAGTNLFQAISSIRDRYFPTPTEKLNTLIILTDGEDTRLEEAASENRRQQIRSLLALLSNPEDKGLRVFTIGVGTEQGKTIPGIEQQGRPVVSSLDETLLKTISRHVGGQYFFANTWTSFDLGNELAVKIRERETTFEEEKNQQEVPLTKRSADLVYDLYFQFPLGLAMLLLVFAIFFPDSYSRLSILKRL